MKLEFVSKKMASIINHQFKIIGENITFEDLSETGEIEIGKNKIMWYDYYKFPSKREVWGVEEMGKGENNRVWLYRKVWYYWYAVWITLQNR